MHIQPFFPEPILVAGNVADAPYDVRVRFVRLVVAGHVAAMAVLTLGVLVGPSVSPRWTLVLLAVGYLGLLVARRAGDGGRAEQVASLALSVPAGLGLVGAGQWALAEGLPMVALPLGSLLFGVYTALCGRDFSFSFVPVAVFGAGALGLAAGAGLGWTAQETLGPTLAALGTWAVYLAYDLAMIVKRRRPDEPVSATIDLFRDPLNFVSYFVRVVRHWRTTRFA